MAGWRWVACAVDTGSDKGTWHWRGTGIGLGLALGRFAAGLGRRWYFGFVVWL